MIKAKSAAEANDAERELEALRRDAELYRALRAMHWHSGLDPKESAEKLAYRIVADHNLNLMAMNNITGFHIGQRVKKVTGEYHISGEVRSIFTKSDGVVRLVVEHQAEGGGSFLHVYGPNNLEAVPSRSNHPPKQTLSHRAAPEDSMNNCRQPHCCNC